MQTACGCLYSTTNEPSDSSCLQADHHLDSPGRCAQRSHSRCLLLPFKSVHFEVGIDCTLDRHDISDFEEHYDLARHHEINPVAMLVLFEIVTSIGALFVSGDPRVLLVRESFVTGSFGLACFASLLLPRPIMFYFGRYFMAGSDPEKRRVFNERLQNPVVHRGHQLVTAVWGAVYLGEFLIRLILIYTVAASVVLAVTPVLLGLAAILTIVWTFRYANKLRERVAQPSA